MKEFGLQIYTVRNTMDTAENIAMTFKKLKEMGYSSFQTAGTPAVSYAEFGKMAAEAGLEIVGTHDDFAMMENDFEQALANHKALGTKLMGIGGYHVKPEETDSKGWAEFIDRVNAVAAKCAEHGMKFTYHNHSHELIKLDNGKTALEMMAEGFDKDNVSFVLDTFWVQHGGGDVRRWIEKLAGRIDILHLKDMKRLPHFDEKRGYQFFAEIGNGNLDWEAILETAEKAGVKYYVVEQDTCPGDPFDSVKMSADYLKANFVK